MQTFTESTVNDTIEKNARFNQNAGFKEYVERRDDGKCCEWFANLSGRYEYGKQPADFFRQHKNCTCTIRHFSDKGTIKSWSGGKGRKQIVLEQKKEQRQIGEELQEKTIQTGAKIQTGALKSQKEKDEHAERYYEEVRNRKPYSDANKIIKHVEGFSRDDEEI